MGHLHSAKETELQPLYRLLRAEKRTDVFTLEKGTKKRKSNKYCQTKRLPFEGVQRCKRSLCSQLQNCCCFIFPAAANLKYFFFHFFPPQPGEGQPPLIQIVARQRGLPVSKVHLSEPGLVIPRNPSIHPSEPCKRRFECVLIIYS